MNGRSISNYTYNSVNTAIQCINPLTTFTEMIKIYDSEQQMK